jgi:hypothetical protein
MRLCYRLLVRELPPGKLSTLQLHGNHLTDMQCPSLNFNLAERDHLWEAVLLMMHTNVLAELSTYLDHGSQESDGTSMQGWPQYRRQL